MSPEAFDFEGPESLAVTVMASGDELKNAESGTAPQSGPRLRVAGSVESKTERREDSRESVADFLVSFISNGEGLSAKEQRRAMVENLRTLLFEGTETVIMNERANGGLYFALQEGVLKNDQASIVSVANYINNLALLRMMSERR